MVLRASVQSLANVPVLYGFNMGLMVILLG
jgi:hypothetical protein